MKSVLSLTLVILASGATCGQHSVSAKVLFSNGNSTELPFRLVNNLVIVQASVNGRSGNFIFDTGAESTVVDIGFAAKTGLKQSGKTTGNGASCTATAGVFKGARVELGGLRTGGLTVYSLPLDSFAPSFGFPIDGIIGNDIIGSVVAEIEYLKNKLCLMHPAAFKPPIADTIPLTMAGHLPFVKARVTPVGHEPLSVLMEIDTGSTGVILLNAPFVKRRGLVATLSASQE
ncbi:MAG TPA: retropepsin-like aspartic protease, partial [Pyrinomonadaceae bacterium]